MCVGRNSTCFHLPWEFYFFCGFFSLFRFRSPVLCRPHRSDHFHFSAICLRGLVGGARFASGHRCCKVRIRFRLPGSQVLSSFTRHPVVWRIRLTAITIFSRCGPARMSSCCHLNYAGHVAFSSIRFWPLLRS